MNMSEYHQIQHLDYNAYCNYLQQKYGLSKEPYYKESESGWIKNRKVTRTKEGLVVHHKMEDRMIWLSKKEIAEVCPHEYQLPENLVYCDYLEHLFLHILICETSPHPEPPIISGESAIVRFIFDGGLNPGIEGITAYIIPELNDYYSGWRPNQPWKKSVLGMVENNKDVYLLLVSRFKKNCDSFAFKQCLRSFNASYGIWNDQNNKELYRQMCAL